MLEYMLVRPIEASVFETTRDWLRTEPDARLTLVVDEAHTYTGARGTEIAYLIRRLKERLDIHEGDGKLRCIATSASLPVADRAPLEIHDFVANLFGEPTQGFHLVVVPNQAQSFIHVASTGEQNAFAAFAQRFDPESPWDAIDQLSNALISRPVDRTATPAVALHRLLHQMPIVIRAVR